MMTTKSQRRVNYEERVEQDGRLTGKHIRTLMHLQDLHSENELLKAKIAELELNQAKAARCDLLDREVHKLRGDLSKCQELHEIAKDAKEKIQQTQRECLMKIDDNCAELSEKHRVEIMRVVSEKLEAENSWFLEKEQLVYQNQDCCRENRDLKEQLELLRRTVNKAEKTSSVLQESRATVESLQERCEQLQSERSSLQKSIQRVSMENDTLRSQVEMLNSRVAVLEMQSKQAQEAKVEQHDLVEQIEKFKTCIQQLEDKNGILVEENLKLDKDNKTLEFNLQDSAQALKHVFKERDLLKNRISGLLNEIAALKSQTPERHAFADFVHLKRDFNALREEHDKLLKRRSSKTNVLPTLKAETSAVSRIQSGGSVRTGTGGV